MATFRATIRVDNLEGEDAAAARRVVEERLRDGGLKTCTVLRVERQSPDAEQRQRRRRIAPGERVWRQQTNTGGFLLAAAALWALWFFWQLGAYLE